VHIRSPEDAAALLAPNFEDADGERLFVAHLGEEERLIELLWYPGGEADLTRIPLREIVADSLRLDARALILAHNHPSGDPRPSALDIDATSRLAGLGALIGLRLADHLIFARTGWTSFRAAGLL
jgi:DNA repair protein RadC